MKLKWKAALEKAKIELLIDLSPNDILRSDMYLFHKAAVRRAQQLMKEEVA